MKALVSPNEPRIDYQGNTGCRIAQVESDDKVFDVAPPLFWSDCPNDCVPDVWWYFNEACELMPVEPLTSASTNEY
jgi:hypothetical protein